MTDCKASGLEFGVVLGLMTSLGCGGGRDCPTVSPPPSSTHTPPLLSSTPPAPGACGAFPRDSPLLDAPYCLGPFPGAQARSSTNHHQSLPAAEWKGNNVGG